MDLLTLLPLLFGVLGAATTPVAPRVEMLNGLSLPTELDGEDSPTLLFR